MIVAIEQRPDELLERTQPSNTTAERFVSGSEVDNFSNLQDDRFVYIVDRVTGTVTFAPSAH